jgi:hypothetical protein
MKLLNRFLFLSCTFSALSMFSQVKQTGFKIDENGDPIPAILLNFDAIFDNTKVELTWSSDTENNNNFFTVEKSKDAVTFETVTSFKGFGNNSTIMSYFDIDFLPYEGISYYRLKQTDVKGTVLSSRLVSVNNKNVNTNLAINQSSVFETQTNMMGSENKEVLVVLRNEKGEESYSKVKIDQNNNIVESENNEIKLELGSYQIVASSDNKLYSQHVVVR